MSQRFPVSTTEVDSLIQQYDRIIPDVSELMAHQGISGILPRPDGADDLENILGVAENGDPILPRDITEVDSVSLGKLFTVFTNWANYLTSILGTSKADLMVMDRQRKVVEMALTAYYRDEKDMPANRVKEKVTLDPRFVEIDRSFIRAKLLSAKVESRLDTMKRSSNLISREQTRRMEELERNRQSDGRKMPVSGNFRRS